MLKIPRFIVLIFLLSGCVSQPTTNYTSNGNQVPSEGITYLEGAARYADVVKVVEHRLESGEPATADLLVPLCIAYENIKNYDGVFKCAKQLDARIQKGDDTARGDYFLPIEIDARAIPSMVRASAYLELGQYQKSIDNADRALSILGVNDSLVMSTWPPKRIRIAVLTTKVIAATLNNDNELAYKTVKRLENEPIPFIGSAMYSPMKENGLARSYMALHQYKKALDHLGGNALAGFARGLANLTNPFAYKGDSLSSNIDIPRLVMQERALLETGQYNKSQKILDQLLKEPRLKDFGDLYWIALYDSARVAEHNKDYNVAIKGYEEAINVFEKERASINSEASKIGFAGDKQEVYGRLINVLIAQRDVKDAFNYVERSKSRALVDMLAAKNDFSVHSPDPQKAKLILAQLDKADLASHIQQAKVSGTESAQFRNLALKREAMQSAAPELSSLVTVSSVTPDKLQSMVGPKEVLVEYYYEGNDLYAFVMDHKQLQATRLDDTGLVDQVRAFRREVENPDSTDWQGLSKALYTRLWQPIAASVGDKNVIIVPHGVLHYLPFIALEAPDGTLLIQHNGTRMLPSASVLEYLHPVVRKKQMPILVLGDPDLGDPRYDLKYAAQEAAAIADMVPDSHLLLRKQATETNFKKASDLFWRIHLATHGNFDADKPLDSGLYLTKDATNDGVLTVGELYSMKLNADLVTLSACETGLGKVANGDDVVGLTRGFLYAGARSIVASLWSVDDKATSELMESFYSNLNNMDKEDALRKAQFRVRNDFPHPYYWAAFQLTGRAN